MLLLSESLLFFFFESVKLEAAEETFEAIFSTYLGNFLAILNEAAVGGRV